MSTSEEELAFQRFWTIKLDYRTSRTDYTADCVVSEQTTNKKQREKNARCTCLYIAYAPGDCASLDATRLYCVDCFSKTRMMPSQEYRNMSVCLRACVLVPPPPML